jgi:hypothetical protein
MIAFGSSLASAEAYAAYARAGVQRVREPDSPVFVYQGGDSLGRVYNLILDHAGARDDLEALVLHHQDVELVGPDFCGAVRAALADPDVAIAGAVGARGAPSIAWWDGEVHWASCAYRYGEFGGGEISGLPGITVHTPALGTVSDVESLYGMVLVLSPWAVRNLRFDEGLPAVFGHDFDICRQGLAAGRRVVCAHLGIVHHHSLNLVANQEAWVAAYAELAEKWDGPDPADEDWKARARHSEAHAGAGYLLLTSHQLQADAIGAVEARERCVVSDSQSWRLTERLRGLNARRREQRSPDVPGR